MSNELITRFIFDTDAGDRRIDLTRRNLLALNNDFNNLGGNVQFSKTISTGFETVSKSAKKTAGQIDSAMKTALADVKRYQNENIKGEKDLTRAVEREARLQSRIKTREARRSANDFIREIKRVEREENNSSRRRVGFNEGLGNLGFGLGSAAVFAGATVAAKSSLDASREAYNSQLRLKASAIETGLAYKELSRQANEFARINLLAERVGQANFSNIVNFAQAADRSDKLELFRQRLSDLAAAKGVDPKRLGDISKQLITLQDEATDLLLNANPSAFYDDFAKSIGKTANSLTDAEKRAAVFDEIIRRGALFSGVAEQRFNASATALDRLSQKFENLKEKAGQAIIPLVEFAEFSVKVASADPKLYRSAAENAEIRRQREKAEQESVESAVRTLQKQDAAIRAALADPRASLENYALRNFNLADSFFSPDQRQKAIDKAIETARSIAENFKNSYQAALSNQSSSLSLLELGQRDFYKNQGLFDNETRRAIAESFERRIEEKRRELEAERKREIDRQKAEAEKRQREIESATKKVRDLEKTYLSVFANLQNAVNSNNPFVRVFSEARSEIDKLREDLRGLPEELQNTALAIQRKINANNLFSARIDNSLDVFGLRQRAEDLRNPFETRSAESLKKEADDIISDFLAKNPNYLFLKGKTDLDDTLRRDILSR